MCDNKLWQLSSKACVDCLLTCVRAEHSTYFTALRSLASFSPLSGDMGRCLFLASFSTVLLSSLRSTWVPTRRNGVRGQWWEISGTHWEREKKQKNVTITLGFKLVNVCINICLMPNHISLIHKIVSNKAGLFYKLIPQKSRKTVSRERWKKTHLLFHVLKGGRRNDREANQEDVCLRIAERPKSVVVFLTWEKKNSCSSFLPFFCSECYSKWGF